MRYDTGVTGIEVLIVLVIVATLAAAGVMRWKEFAVQRECLALGYRDGDWRIIGPSYCIRRTDQTDVVVTLDEARAKGRVVP